jgi:hypothetical protein
LSWGIDWWVLGADVRGGPNVGEGDGGMGWDGVFGKWEGKRVEWAELPTMISVLVARKKMQIIDRRKVRQPSVLYRQAASFSILEKKERVTSSVSSTFSCFLYSTLSKPCLSLYVLVHAMWNARSIQMP